jgi:putative addiction module CopG family antidote
MNNWVAARIKSGAYKSSSEVIRDGLRTLQRLEEQRLAMAADLRQELMIGIRQLDAGKSRPFDVATVDAIKQKGRERLGA